MTLAIGTRVGPHEIVSPLAAGDGCAELDSRRGRVPGVKPRAVHLSRVYDRGLHSRSSRASRARPPANRIGRHLSAVASVGGILN